MWILFPLALITLVGFFIIAFSIGYEHPVLALFSAVAAVLVSLTLLISGFTYYDVEYVKDQTAECLAAGDDGLIVQYSAPDICVTSDGSIIFDWKK